jgi:DNA-binding NtrC family response regulator
MIRGLRIFDISPGANPVRADFSLENLSDPLWLTALKKPSVYLVKQSDLREITSGCGAIIDRKVKDSRKGLSKYLLGLRKKGIPLIDGNYEDTRQIFRSIRDLLSRAREAGERSLYIVGIRDAFFEEIEGVAEAASRRPSSASRHVHQDTGALPSGRSDRLLDGQTHPDSPSLPLSSHDVNYIGESQEARLVREMVLSAAAFDHPVLIIGGSGTGKDVVAHEIHRLSGRKGVAPVRVKCGALTGTLLLTELFGHARGAFTGATGKKAGAWEQAADGTLFLDEIGDLQADHQAGILHALQDGMITPLGTSKAISVNARITAATNRDLSSMVGQGQFREDLFESLSGLIIRTPSLRDIPDDIPLIALKMWKEIARDEKATLPAEVLDELACYTWPGNGRELKTVLGQLQALFGNADLKARHARMIFSLQGQAPLRADETVKEISMHRLSRTLTRLRNITETLHAIDAAIAHLRGSERGQAAPVADTLRFHLSDLEYLCREPSFFGEKETFLAVHHLHGQLSYYFDSLQKGAGDSLTTARDQIRVEIARAVSRVLLTGRALLDKSNTRTTARMRG